MENITNEELQSINGGVLKIAASKFLVAAGAAVSFLIGLVNGYQRPLSCNK